MARYLRIASLGDSTTFGIGDPVPDHVSPSGWRGWARLLSGSLASAYDVSFCNLAVSGATSRCVVEGQLADAVAHRPDVASLVVGVNDTMRSTWDVARIRADLMGAAEALHGTGALLLTARFHDHGRVFGLPGVLRRPLAARIEAVNEIYDEMHATYGGLRVDLATFPEVLDRSFWSVDRLHPSELGHRLFARHFADLLAAEGFDFEPVSVVPEGGVTSSWRTDVRWMVAEGAPWVGRRARDLGPWAVRLAWTEARGARDGGGAGGLELTFALRQRYAEASTKLTLVAGHAGVLSGFSASVRRLARKELARQGIALVEEDARLAEYAMLPGSTHTRSDRESVKGRIGGRTHEISRLIGRSLRAVIDYEAMGENTIQLDCDVLQADGGTRTAAITGAYVALADACASLDRMQTLTGSVAAVSVGIIDGVPRLDLPYVEDVRAETDMNVVMTGTGSFVEVQGTAEGAAFSRTELDALLGLAEKGCADLTRLQQEALAR